MGRWEPNARGRLEQAAMDLFGEQGFDQTTVAEIAARAGLTERTFFRHYTDKREVLFGGSETLADMLVAAVADTPDSAPPLDAVVVALEQAGALIQESRGRDFARVRRSIIVANPDLQERELIKLASWAESLADALRDRGVEETAGMLAAQTGITIFHVAFGRWVADGNDADLPALIRISLGDLKALTSDARQPATESAQAPL